MARRWKGTAAGAVAWAVRWPFGLLLEGRGMKKSTALPAAAPLIHFFVVFKAPLNHFFVVSLSSP